MAGESAEIREAVRRLSGVHKDQVTLIECTVDSVDMTTRTCAATTVNGTSEMDIENIQIMPGVSDGFILKPKVGSTIFVAYSNRNLPFVQMFSEIDAVYLICDNVLVNDGSYGGLIKIVDLTGKLNSMVSQLQTELGKIAIGITAAGGSYTPGTISEFNKGDYENTKFTHG